MSFSVKEIYEDDIPAGYAQAITLHQASAALREILRDVPVEILCTTPAFLADLRGLEMDFFNEGNRIFAEEDRRFYEFMKQHREAHNDAHVA